MPLTYKRRIACTCCNPEKQQGNLQMYSWIMQDDRVPHQSKARPRIPRGGLSNLALRWHGAVSSQQTSAGTRCVDCPIQLFARLASKKCWPCADGMSRTHILGGCQLPVRGIWNKEEWNEFCLEENVGAYCNGEPMAYTRSKRFFKR